MTDSLLAEAVEQFTARCCTPERVRAVEADPGGDAARVLWRDVVDSGFADILLAEESGGGGFGFEAAALVAFACGRRAMPLPLALTTAVRKAASRHGDVPQGPATIAPAILPAMTAPLILHAVPYGLVAETVLVSTSDGDWLLPAGNVARTAHGGYGTLTCDLEWSTLPEGMVELGRPHGTDQQWRATAAALVAAEMAGAMEQLLGMTIGYANMRSQFGQPIGKRQAIQQQISIMSEHAIAARMAAQIGLCGAEVDPLRAAVAKARAGEAALAVTAIAHAVHGAIGMTEAFDLQLYTRRLAEWRGQYGGESYWQEYLGRAFLHDSRPTLTFLGETVAGRTSARPQS